MRHLFAVKLSKKLLSIRLPPSYLSIFVLAGSEPQKTEKATVYLKFTVLVHNLYLFQFRKMVVSTVDKRRKAFSELLKAQGTYIYIHSFQYQYDVCVL